MSTIIIRLGGLFLLVSGALVVTHDLGTFAYGEPDATVLAMLLAFGQWSGRGEWQSYLMWILPMVMGAVMLFIPLARPRSRRLPRQPGR